MPAGPLAAQGNQPQQNQPQASPPAQAAHTPDLWITIFSEPGKDQVAVAYNADTPDARIKQDFAEIAQNLGHEAPKVKITKVEGIPAAEATFTGLSDWRTGATNLDPLIQTYKRYGKFRVSYFFMGNFPQQPTLSFQRPPLSVQGERAGNTLHYRVSIDQTNGVPETVPVVTASEQGGDQNRLLGIIALAAVVAVAIFLVVYVILGQRRRRAPNSLGRPAGQPGSAASGSAGEGK